MVTHGFLLRDKCAIAWCLEHGKSQINGVYLEHKWRDENDEDDDDEAT